MRVAEAVGDVVGAVAELSVTSGPESAAVGAG
jgi:hypothetical protein